MSNIKEMDITNKIANARGTRLSRLLDNACREALPMPKWIRRFEFLAKMYARLHKLEVRFHQDRCEVWAKGKRFRTILK